MIVHVNPLEVAELSRRMDAPMDLNDALLSVARDNAVASIMQEMQRMIEADIMAVIGVPDK